MIFRSPSYKTWCKNLGGAAHNGGLSKRADLPEKDCLDLKSILYTSDDGAGKKQNFEADLFQGQQQQEVTANEQNEAENKQNDAESETQTERETENGSILNEPQEIYKATNEKSNEKSNNGERNATKEKSNEENQKEENAVKYTLEKKLELLCKEIELVRRGNELLRLTGNPESGNSSSWQATKTGDQVLAKDVKDFVPDFDCGAAHNGGLSKRADLPEKDCLDLKSILYTSDDGAGKKQNFEADLFQGQQQQEVTANEQNEAENKQNDAESETQTEREIENGSILNEPQEIYKATNEKSNEKSNNGERNATKEKSNEENQKEENAVKYTLEKKLELLCKEIELVRRGNELLRLTGNPESGNSSSWQATKTGDQVLAKDVKDFVPDFDCGAAHNGGLSKRADLPEKDCLDLKSILYTSDDGAGKKQNFEADLFQGQQQQEVTANEQNEAENKQNDAESETQTERETENGSILNEPQEIYKATNEKSNEKSNVVGSKKY
ncbi:DNA ligase 1-like [Drosophila tropicalis]|uniref:DNA ligase 1-like n=1 Tax=Drosophila tropicalis TaxID=46794 RepID=UPI0035ABF84C